MKKIKLLSKITLFTLLFILLWQAFGEIILNADELIYKGENSIGLTEKEYTNETQITSHSKSSPEVTRSEKEKITISPQKQKNSPPYNNKIDKLNLNENETQDSTDTLEGTDNENMVLPNQYTNSSLKAIVKEKSELSTNGTFESIESNDSYSIIKYTDEFGYTLEFVVSNTLKSINDEYSVDKHGYPLSQASIDDYSPTRWGQIMYFRVNNRIVFCIEPTANVNALAYETNENTSVYSKLSISQQTKIAQAISYGLNRYNSTKNEDYLYATQMVIYEFIAPDKYDLSVNTPLKAKINTILNDLAMNDKIPSFTKPTVADESLPTYQLKWDGTQYSIILEDKNSVYDTKFKEYGTFGDYTISNAGTNKIKITTRNHDAKTQKITNIFKPYSTGNARFFDANQDLVTVPTDNLHVAYNLEIKKAFGRAELTKVGAPLDNAINQDDRRANIALANVEFKLYLDTDNSNNVTNDDNLIGTYKTNSQGKIEIPNLITGEYVIQETKTLPGYEIPQKDGQNYYYDFTLEAGEKQIIGGWNLYGDDSKYGVINKRIEGEIDIFKSDDEGNALSDVTFGIYQNDKLVKTIKSDDKGHAKTILVYGTYTVKELETATGYINNGWEETFTLEKANEIFSFNVTNKIIRGDIRGTKSGESLANNDTELTKLAGVKFALYQNGKQIATTTTDAKGNWDFTNLKYGIYQVREIATIDGYNLGGFNKTVVIDQDGEINTFDVNNEVIKGTALLTKLGREYDGGYEKLANVEFTIYQDTNNDNIYETQIGKYQTNNLGVLKINNLKYGNYKIVETNVGNNYWTNFEETFKIKKANEIYNINEGKYIVNEKLFGEIEINKTGETLDDATISQQVLEGVEYSLFKDLNANNKLENYEKLFAKVDVKLTNKKGQLKFTNLPVNSTYFLKETKTLASHVLDDKITTINFLDYQAVENKIVVEFDFINQIKKGQFELTKHGHSKFINNGATYSLPGVQYGVYLDLNQNGQIDPKDKLMEKITTDSTGYVKTKRLKFGHYLIKELSAPENYSVNPQIIEAEINDDKEVINITKDRPLVNELHKAPIEINKIDQFGKKISGITFTITDQKGNVVETLITDKIGRAKSKLLPFGEYKIQETIGKNGYFTDDTVYNVKVNETTYLKRSPLTVTHINNIYTGNVIIKKTDENGNVLANAKFSVHQDTNNNAKLDKDDLLVSAKLVSDAEGLIKLSFNDKFKMINENGKSIGYFLTETKAPTGYHYDATPKLFAFTFADTDGDTVVDRLVENKTHSISSIWAWDDTIIKKDLSYTIEIKNKLITNEMVIEKTDMATGQEIAGAKIVVYDSKGNIYEEWISTSSSHKFSAEYGKYTMCETVAPVGYQKLKQCVKFEVSKDNVVQHLKIENELLKENKILITGFNVFSYITLICITIIGLILIKKKLL